MPLTEAEKNAIVEKVVAILRAPDKKARIEALRAEVLDAQLEGQSSVDDAAYAVLQALEELYG
jgi:hypothetical protein